MKSNELSTARELSVIELDRVSGGGGCGCAPGDPCVTNTGMHSSSGNEIWVNCSGVGYYVSGGIYAPVQY